MVLLRVFAASSRASPFRQSFQRLLGDEDFLEGEQLLCVYIGSSGKRHRFDVAPRLQSVLIKRIRDQQNFPGVRLFFQQTHERLRFELRHNEFVDRQNITRLDSLAQRFPERQTSHGF